MVGLEVKRSNRVRAKDSVLQIAQSAAQAGAIDWPLADYGGVSLGGWGRITLLGPLFFLEVKKFCTQLQSSSKNFAGRARGINCCPTTSTSPTHALFRYLHSDQDTLYSPIFPPKQQWVSNAAAVVVAVVVVAVVSAAVTVVAVVASVDAEVVSLRYYLYACLRVSATEARAEPVSFPGADTSRSLFAHRAPSNARTYS